MPHGHPPGWAPSEIGLFIDQHVRGGSPLPKLGEPRIEAGRIRLKCTSPVELRKAEVHRTSDTAAINKREWKTQQATIEDKTIVAEAPPADTTAWFVTVTDSRGAIVSTRVTIATK
jgi:hypothetical protein